MKVIDFDRKGNVVRLYLGKDGCEDYWGDDWNDTPYEHNAGTVYPEFISGIMDIFIPYAFSVIEPKDDWNYRGNTPFCKEDMKDRNVPGFIIVPPEMVRDFWGEPAFSRMIGSDNVYKIYFNDSVELVKDILTDINGYVSDIINLTYDEESRELHDDEGLVFDPYYDMY